MPRPAPGNAVLLTGLPGAGKTTLARATAAHLTAAGTPAQVLDADALRRELWPELGHSPEDRTRNLLRMAAVATLLARHGTHALIAAISPYARARAAMRAHLAAAGIHLAEIHVATPLHICRARDPKGLYARHARGEIHGLTGIDAPYEPPAAPELTLDTTGEDPETTARRLTAHLLATHLLATRPSRTRER